MVQVEKRWIFVFFVIFQKQLFDLYKLIECFFM